MTNRTVEDALSTVNRVAPTFATSRSTALATGTATAGSAARSAVEIAAQLPVPGADVADRLLELLLPCKRRRAEEQQAA
jgi:hypothetical protein